MRYKLCHTRLLSERKLDDGLRLLVSGTLLFLAHGQEDDGTKLSVMLGDHLLTNHTTPSGICHYTWCFTLLLKVLFADIIWLVK